MWTIRIPHSHVDKLLKILRPRIIPALPKNTKTLLKLHCHGPKVEQMEAADGSMGEFLYFGLKENLEKMIDTSLHDTDTILIECNIDGFTPFKSSKKTMWPILCKIYTKLDLYEPFTVALFSGNGKPKSSKDFAQKFIVELNLLKTASIVLDGKSYKVKLLYFVCDTPARSFLKNIISHVGFNACERCLVYGEKKLKVTVFLNVNAEIRTNESFRQFIHPEHHTGPSPICLIEPSIDMVSQFVLDPMHMVYLGCMKRILDFLLNLNFKCRSRLSSTMKAELKRRTKMIQKDIPSEFPRKMRDSDQYTDYKTVEFKFMCEYAAAVVFKKLLSNEIYDSLMLLLVPCRLLNDKNNCVLNVDQARSYLKTFVANAPNVFGDTFVTVTVHNLIHMPDDIKNFGSSMSELSAFWAESYLGKMRKFLKSPIHLVSQYKKRILEINQFSTTKIELPVKLQIIKED